MTQSYASRVEARPGYARFKNRKQTIRRRFQAGRITDEQRDDLLAEARERYRTSPDIAPAPVLTDEQQAMLDLWHAEHPESPCQNDLCLSARATSCCCPCEGRWHGAALGRTLPRWVVRACAHPDCDADVTGRDGHARYCSYACGRRARHGIRMLPCRRCSAPFWPVNGIGGRRWCTACRASAVAREQRQGLARRRPDKWSASDCPLGCQWTPLAKWLSRHLAAGTPPCDAARSASADYQAIRNRRQGRSTAADAWAETEPRPLGDHHDDDENDHPPTDVHY